MWENVGHCATIQRLSKKLGFLICFVTYFNVFKLIFKINKKEQKQRKKTLSNLPSQ
jgi:preprotein translocase subunit YajC